MSVFPVPSKRGSLLTAGLLLLAAGLLLPSRAQAQFVTNSPDPFQGSTLTLQAANPVPYPLLGYGQTFTLTNISEMTNTIVSGNDVIDYSAKLNAIFYTAPDLATFKSSITLPGSFQVTLMGRTSPFETGTFNYDVDSIDFSGILGGHTFQIQLNPEFVSGGVTTITAGPGVGQYTVTAPAVLYPQRVVDDGTPVNGPALTVTVGGVPSSVPEPGVLQMTAVLGMGGLLTWRRTRRRN